MKLWSPIIWFYLLVASLPFIRIPSALIFGVHIRLSIVIGAVFILLVFVKNPRAFLPQTFIARLLYGFLIVCVLSAINSQRPLHALTITAFTLFTALLAVASSQIIDQINLRTFLKTLFFSALASALFGLYQFIGDLLGIPTSFTGLRSAYTAHVFGFPRIQSTALEPLYYANYLLLPISLLIALGSYLKRTWLISILLTTILMLTLSRGGVAALAMMALGWILLYIVKHKYRQIGVIAGVGVASIILTIAALIVVVPALYKAPINKPALSAYSDQLTNYEVGDFKADRTYTRKIALEAFKENPWLGVGPGNFGRYINAKDTRYPISQIVNNEPDELLAETGVLGFGVFFAFALALGINAIRQLRRFDTPMTQLGWGLLFYLFAAGIQYYSFSTLYIVHIWVAIGLLLGITFALQRRPSRHILSI